ncbi:MAG: dihydroorotate dehydrogenase electron transfer subunit [Bacillota bacterium]
MRYFPAVEISRQEKLAADCYRISFISPEIAGLARPGQFLHVRINPGLEPLLRRPFSVHAVNQRTGEIALLYRVVGRGTRLLAQKKKGDLLDLIGPLGRGFTLPAAGQNVALVAGGIGIAPLYFLLQTLAGAGNSPDVLLGARTAGELFLASEVRELAGKAAVLAATDDGSYGHRAPVTELLAKLLAEKKVEIVYACGPAAMLKVVASLLEQYGVDGEISLEERMGCGVGACLSCVCKMRDKKGQDVSYRRVCLEGPVFKAREVVWQDFG